MSDLARRDFRRILLIKPSSAGDLLHALPALRALRRRFPQAHLAWLVNAPLAELIAHDPALDEVIAFDRRRYGRLWRSPAVATDFARFARDLRRRRFDLVVDLQGLIRSGLLALFSGAAVRIGFRAAREFGWIGYTHRVRPPVGARHAVDRNAALIAELGAAPTAADLALSPSEAARAAAGDLLADAGVAPDEPFVALAPATRWETKNWPAERFAALAREVHARLGLRSVLIGSPDERPILDAVHRGAGDAAVDLAGRTPLTTLPAVIERARLVVCGDSLPMHLAAALARPLVAIFGPTNPDWTGPYGRLRDVLRDDVPCSPCRFQRLRDCPAQHVCMSGIDVERVCRAIAARLELPATAPCGSRGA
ncbi:MAG: lipopolysaccharide heptosyltransferase II [Phycisphaerae bacterium]